jgi:HAD superfamily hydrolase (TIGR01509 family)
MPVDPATPQPDTPWTVRCVVFDLDGLLVDTEPVFQEAARRLLARRDRVLTPEIAQAIMGSPALQCFPLLQRHYRLTEPTADLVEESMVLFFEVLGEQPAPLLAGAVELLDRLAARGIPRAIATSSGARYVERVLGPHTLLDRFAFVLTCEDVQRGKPFPEVYEKAAARFGCRPAEMVVLEDSPNGLHAAKAAGARCIVVPHALVPRDDLVGADAVLSSLKSPRLYELLGVR